VQRNWQSIAPIESCPCTHATNQLPHVFFIFWFGMIGIRFSGTLGLNPGRRTPFSNLMSPLTCIQVRTQYPFIPQLHFQTSKSTVELRLQW
jgi:hypothetical protein